MIKLYTLAIGGTLMATLSSAAYAAPTRTLFTETAETAADSYISIDLEYQFSENGTGTAARIGAFNGEVLLNVTNSGFAASSIGYKKVIGENLAAYGILSYLNDDRITGSFLDIAIGAAYTIKSGDVTFNLNGEFITDDSETQRGGDNTIFLKGAAIIPLNTTKKDLSLIAEVALENNDFIDTSTALGIRWQPAARLTTDFIF